MGMRNDCSSFNCNLSSCKCWPHATGLNILKCVTLHVIDLSPGLSGSLISLHYGDRLSLVNTVVVVNHFLCVFCPTLCIVMCIIYILTLFISPMIFFCRLQGHRSLTKPQIIFSL